MNKRRAMAVLLPSLVLASLTVAAPAARAGEAAAMAAVVAPATVWPNAAPCTTGTGVHDFTVGGSGFHADEGLSISVGDVAYPSAAADATGAYSLSYEIRSLPAAAYRVEIVGDQGGTAVGKINVGYSGCRSTKDGTLRLTGGGFTAAGTIGVYLDGEPAAAATATSTANGEFDFRTPCAPGPHTLKLADGHDHALSFAAFTC